MRACSESWLMQTVYKAEDEAEKQKFSEEFGIREPLTIFRQVWAMTRSQENSKNLQCERIEEKMGLKIMALARAVIMECNVMGLHGFVQGRIDVILIHSLHIF